MHTAICLAALAVALAGCTIETRYVPHTPHRLALGMKNREAGFYLDGKFIKLSDADVALTRCSPAASADLSAAVVHHGSGITNVVVADIFYGVGLGVYLAIGGYYYLAAVGVGFVFALRAGGAREQSYAAVVDTINRFNDDPRCAP